MLTIITLLCTQFSFAQGPSPAVTQAGACSTLPANAGGQMQASDGIAVCETPAPMLTGNLTANVEYIVTDSDNILTSNSADGSTVFTGPAIAGIDADGIFDPAEYGFAEGDEFCVTAIVYNLSDLQAAVDMIFGTSSGINCCSAIESTLQEQLADPTLEVCNPLCQDAGICSGSDVTSFANLLDLLGAFGAAPIVEGIVDVIENSINTQAGSGLPCTEAFPVCWALSGSNNITQSLCYTYSCAPPCPTFVSASAASNVLCNGASTTLSVALEGDLSATTINWFGPNGFSAIGNDISVTPSVDGCTTTVAYTYDVLCDGVSIAQGSVDIIVYPDVTATVLGEGNCFVELSTDCPEFTAEWASATTIGNGFSFVANEGETGMVTFVVSNSDAPAACNEIFVTAMYDCPIPCPTFFGAFASTEVTCDATVDLGVEIDGSAEDVTVIWAGGDYTGAFVTVETFSGACTTVNTFDYQVICNASEAIIAEGAVNVTVFPAIAATVNDGGCAASINVECPDFVVSWNDGTMTGTGSSYAAAQGTNGTVTFTVENNDASDFACASAEFTATYDCAVPCPTVVSANIDADVICSGDEVNLSMTLEGDASLATVTWANDDVVFTGQSITVNPTTVCTDVVVYVYEVMCDGGVLASGEVEITVFPNIEATANDGACVASVTPACPEFTVTWADATMSGAGNAYTAAAGTAGTVTFTVSNDDAFGLDCQTADFTATYDCAIPCPTVVSASADNEVVCSGTAVNLSLELDGDASETTVTWTGNNETFAGQNVSVTPTASCTDVVTYAYDVVCSGVSVATGEVAVTVFPDIAATTTDGTCSAAVTPACPEFTVTWNDGTTTGVGANYEAALGTAGTVTFTVSNDDAFGLDCQTADFTAAYDCPAVATCPDFVSASADATAICNGEATNLMVTLSGDASQTTVMWSANGQTWTGESITVNPTTICNATVSYAYEVMCGGESIAAGAVDVMVYPTITATINDGGCAISISQDCPEFMAIWATGDEAGSGFAYEGTAGSGTVTFTILNTAATATACGSASFTADYSCEVPCPTVMGFNNTPTDLCAGGSINLFAMSDMSEDITWSWSVAINDGETTEFANASGAAGEAGSYMTIPNNSCNADMYDFYLTATCTATGAYIMYDGMELNNYLVHTAMAYPTLMAGMNFDIQEGTCNEVATITTSCANFGVSGSFQAACGDGTGTFAITVNNTNAPTALACQTTTIDVAYNCTDICDVLGCTDAAATNFNPSATSDDGSCIYAACTDPTAINYTEPAFNVSTDNSLCLYVDCLLDASLESTSQGDGGTNAFGYDNYTLTYSGDAPFTFEWDKSGYVRSSILENGIMSIVTSDEANFSVTITDNNGCATIVTSPNLEGVIVTELAIVDYSITVVSNLNSNNGAVDISVLGGVPPYSYTWSNGAATQDIAGLELGWYTVLVTDSQGASTIGWYWVSKQRRGRGKTMEQDATMQAYPNPFTNETTITFAVPTDAKANLAIYDVAGKQVAQLFDATATANTPYTLNFDAANLNAGIYIAQLTTENGVVSHQKLMVTK